MTPKADRVHSIPADERVRAGRLDKAVQFLEVANAARDLSSDEDVADAATTLYVHAGIAASDAICARSLGKHAKGADHNMATTLLASVDKKSAENLRTLLGMKTRAGYGHEPISAENLKRAERAASQLVREAQK